MNSFYKLIAGLIKESEESTHSSFKVADPTAVGENPVRELVLDVVSLGDESNNSIVSLAWNGGNKVIEKKTSSDEASHMAQLISSDLAQAVKLTSEDKYDEAKNVITNVLKTYAETTDTPVSTNMPPVTTTMASKEFDGLWKEAKITMQNLWFSNPDELLEFQTKMKELQPKTDQDSVPLWDMNKGKAPEGEESPELAPPSVSYQDLEKEKELEQKNITKRIENEVKEQIESSLEQKQATLFTDKDKQLVDALRGVGRSWEEIRDFMTKSLKYEKEDVAAYLDQFRGNEKGEEINVIKEKSLPEVPRPPESLVSPETHEKLLKDLDKEPIEEKKSEPPVKEVKEPKFTPKEIMEIPEEEEVEEKESSLEEISRADNSEIRRVASQGKTALNPLQEKPVVTEPTQETPTQDTIPMGTGFDHPTPKPEDWVIVKSDLEGELPSFRAKFVSEETHNDGSKWGIVDRDGDLLTVEMYRISKESEGAQTTEPVSAPELAQPKEDEISVTPKQSDLYNESSLNEIKAEVKKLEAQLNNIEKEASETFRSPVAVEDLYMKQLLGHEEIAFTKETTIQWQLDLEMREWGVKSVYVTVPDQVINLDYEYFQEESAPGAGDDGYIKDSKKVQISDVQVEGLDRTGFDGLAPQILEYTSDGKWTLDFGTSQHYSFKYPRLVRNAELPPEHICERCKKPMGYQGFISPVCDKCVREQHKKVTGSIGKEAIKVEFVEEENKHGLKDLSKFLNSKFKNQEQMEMQLESLATEWAMANGYTLTFPGGDVLRFVSKVIADPDKLNEELAKKPIQSSLELKAADPEPVKTEYKELKKAPDFVDPKSAVPVSPDMESVLVKMESLQSKLSVLDQAKEKIKMAMEQELQKIDVGGERASIQKELQDSYEKLGILIDATESKVINWGDKLYTLQHQEKEVTPQPSTKELLAKIYSKFEGAERYVESVLNGFKALAKKVQTKRLVQWPKRSSLEQPMEKEASVMDDFNQLNEDMLKALQALS